MRRNWLLLTAFSLLAIVASGCASITPPTPSAEGEGRSGQVELTSSAFGPGEIIPQTYTCDGEDISPPLSWGDPPEGTESFVLIVDDPDAPIGTFVHWVLFNIPASQRSLPEAVPAQDQLSNGSVHGRNGWRKLAYGGPCPPSGSTHRYVFKLYALDTALDADAGATKKQVLSGMEGHVLAEAELTGEYTRQ